MNKTLFAVAAFALFGAVQPASAMMCGSGQQTQAAGNSVSTGMMCGGAAQAADDPMADKPAQQPQQQSGMCPCCRNMAMMGGRSGGGMMHNNMPGMEMPKR